MPSTAVHAYYDVFLNTSLTPPSNLKAKEYQLMLQNSVSAKVLLPALKDYSYHETQRSEGALAIMDASPTCTGAVLQSSGIVGDSSGDDEQEPGSEIVGGSIAGAASSSNAGPVNMVLNPSGIMGDSDDDIIVPVAPLVPARASSSSSGLNIVPASEPPAPVPPSGEEEVLPVDLEIEGQPVKAIRMKVYGAVRYQCRFEVQCTEDRCRPVPSLLLFLFVLVPCQLGMTRPCPFHVLFL